MSSPPPISGRDRLLWMMLIVVLSSVFGLTAWSRLHQAEPVSSRDRDGADSTPADSLGLVPDFHLIERSGRSVDRSDLLGQVWVASFIFTRCPGPCLKVTAAMAELQDRLAGSGVRLVTMSVDPRHDTPAVLAAYADRFRADRRRWLFLTGDRDRLYQVIRDGFHLGVAADPEGERSGGGIIHSTRLVLVDRRGRIRKYFDSTDPSDLDRLVRLAGKLVEERS